MNLVLDENLSPRLVGLLAAGYTDVCHVKAKGWIGWLDRDIWPLCNDPQTVLVTKDRDFEDMALLRGRPPLVVRLLIGNLSNELTAAILLREKATIEDALRNPDKRLLRLEPVRSMP